MSQPLRTEAGGLIDRSRPLHFTFDGRQYQGYAGDTLASALLANAVHPVARSFKYHRPRGIMAAGTEEPNALVTLDPGGGRVTPNTRATQVELTDGLVARSQNRWPSLRFDTGAIAGLAAPWLGAGFYYKRFIRPRSFWHRVYEPWIRRMAGLGRAPVEADPDRYAHQYAHCDLLIIGGGPAGLATALGACLTGARVILCDEQARFGGSLLSRPHATIDGWPARQWVEEVLATLAEHVTLLPRTTAFGWYPDQMIGLSERLPGARRDLPTERLWQVRAERVVLATGAIERPVVFPGNDRPGVMLAHAAATYLHRYGVKAGQRAVVVTETDEGYALAAALHADGIAVAGIVDRRPRTDGDVGDAGGVPVYAGVSIAGTEGRMRVRSVVLSRGAGVIPCDTVLMAGGWTPSVHLAAQSRAGLMFEDGSGTWLPAEGAVGACAGVFDLAGCLRDGVVAGGSGDREFVVEGVAPASRPVPPVPGPVHPKAFVDFQNDVTTQDLATAAADGFVSIEHVKRYTTAGMATDQGKTSNLNVAAAVAALTERSVQAVGLTTYRPPYTPVSFGALAGAFRGPLYAPVRRTPIATPDAVMEDVGAWKRARCFPRDGESPERAVERECLAVRNAVGIMDASTLGKIEVVGPDAAAFLERMYVGRYARMPVGRCRYALLLGEDGCIRDDGVVARLAPDRFLVTTTTGGAAFVLDHMEDYLQTEYPELRVWLTSVTENWAVIAVQGPQAASLLAPFLRGIDLADMPHPSVRECRLGDVAIRLFRMSFTGESGFEINVPPPEAQRVWDTLRARGATPYGTEAMHVLRAEKGHILVGQETDGTVTPADLGLERLISTTKGDFIGRRSLSLPALRSGDRPELIGLLPVPESVVLEEGAQVTEPGSTRSIGWVTSAYRSPTLRRGFALAMVVGGRARMNATLSVVASGRAIGARVTPPVFHDPDGSRLDPVAAESVALEDLPPAEAGSAPIALPASGITLRMLERRTRLSVRGGSAAATAIGLGIGVLLPTAPCRSVIARNRAALWVGPDEWLIHAPAEESELASRASAAARPHPASVTDVSDRSLALELAGPRAAWCLNGFCALDLHPAAFPVGMCTRTLVGKAPVVLWRLAAEVFHLDVPRSFVGYVWTCLEEARLPFREPGIGEEAVEAGH
jgi:sarcosine oxidase subunit alpha